MRGVILIFLTMLISTATIAEVKTIRAIVSDSNAPPFAIFDSNAVLSAGISRDILEALVSRGQLELQYLPLPRGRVEQWLLNDHADIACFLNPAWVEQAEKLLWSMALFSTRQVIVRRTNSPAINQVTDLLGKRIGTDRGFSYPEFDSLFTQKLLTRDDAISLESNLSRLEKQRVDAVLTVDLAFQYYQQIHDNLVLTADALWTQPDTLYCAFNPHEPELAYQIKQILYQMTEDGTISTILERYRPKQAKAL